MPTASVADPPSCLAVTRHALKQHALEQRRKLTVYGVSLPSGTHHPFGDATFAHREDAERFIQEVRKRQPDLAGTLQIEELVLETGGLN